MRSYLLPFLALSSIIGLQAELHPADAAEAAGSDGIKLIVADGQLKSHPFLVFVTHEITTAMDPRMILSGSHVVLSPAQIEKGMHTPFRVAPGQTRTIDVAGTLITERGTLLIFDLRKSTVPWFKSGVRLLPSLQWTEMAEDGNTAVVRQAVANDEIFLGNMLGAVLWTGLIVLLIVWALLTWSRAKSVKITTFTPRPSLLLVTGPDGYLSLWRTQLMLWTFAVGSLVFLFGLVRLRIPEIPETLVALMGMSLLTGGLSATEARKDANAKPGSKTAGAGAGAGTAASKRKAAAGSAAPKETPAGKPAEGEKARGAWADLIAVWNESLGQIELSVPKAQMVTWTALILGLFIVKSVLEGSLWSVPWQMVALTGVSQAGYIGDKYIKRLVPIAK